MTRINIRLDEWWERLGRILNRIHVLTFLVPPQPNARRVIIKVMLKEIASTLFKCNTRYIMLILALILSYILNNIFKKYNI
jgi:hypothetical protein